VLYWLTRLLLSHSHARLLLLFLSSRITTVLSVVDLACGGLNVSLVVRLSECMRSHLSGECFVTLFIMYIFYFITINDGNNGKAVWTIELPVVVGYKRKKNVLLVVFLRFPENRDKTCKIVDIWTCAISVFYVWTFITSLDTLYILTFVETFFFFFVSVRSLNFTFVDFSE